MIALMRTPLLIEGSGSLTRVERKKPEAVARSGIDPEKKVEHPGPRIDTDARGMVTGLARKKHYPIGLFR